MTLQIADLMPAERAAWEVLARYYWLTRENNAVARALYERVTKCNGFICYDFAL
mgnify:CR=1 FL=1